jgi:hypothetical protein
LELGAAP